MSIKVMSHVWEHSKQKSGALILLLAMADFARDDGSGVFASVSHLAKKARLKDRQVQYILRKLVRAGELLMIRDGGRKHQSNTYRIVIHKVIHNLDQGAKSAPLPADQGCTPLHPRVHSTAPMGAAHCTPNRQERSINIISARPRARKPSSKSSQTSDPLRTAASLATFRRAQTEVSAEISAITRPAGRSYAQEPSEPSRKAELTRLRERYAALEDQIHQLLPKTNAAK